MILVFQKVCTGMDVFKDLEDGYSLMVHIILAGGKNLMLLDMVLEMLSQKKMKECEKVYGKETDLLKVT